MTIRMKFAAAAALVAVAAGAALISKQFPATETTTVPVSLTLDGSRVVDTSATAGSDPSASSGAAAGATEPAIPIVGGAMGQDVAGAVTDPGAYPALPFPPGADPRMLGVQGLPDLPLDPGPGVLPTDPGSPQEPLVVDGDFLLLPDPLPLSPAPVTVETAPPGTTGGRPGITSPCRGITADVIAAQIAVETGWNARTVSPAGAEGLAQLLPGTWKRVAVDGDGDGDTDPFDPKDAVPTAAAHLCDMYHQVEQAGLKGNTVALALAAYHAGIDRVRAAKGMPDIALTRRTVGQIVMNLHVGKGDTKGPSWHAPLDGSRVTSSFGRRTAPLPGASTLHRGVDLAADVGDPVRAAARGVVLDAGTAKGFGRWVRIQHEDGSTTVYGHLAKVAVHSGDWVEGGEQVATAGTEGISTGPHLHFEVRGKNGPVDPVTFFRNHGATLTT